MSTFKHRDSQREEFRKYLEKSGAIETLTKILASLYEEPAKPPSALEYIKEQLLVTNPHLSELDSLRKEVAKLRATLHDANGEIDRLKATTTTTTSDESIAELATAAVESPVNGVTPSEESQRPMPSGDEKRVDASEPRPPVVPPVDSGSGDAVIDQ